MIILRPLSRAMGQFGSLRRYHTVSSDYWKYVERVIPNELVPDPPQHSQYPTPSGWFPPEKTHLSDQCPYLVRRTRFHQMPIYDYSTIDEHVPCVRIRKIEGDVWRMRDDLKTFLDAALNETNEIQVDEIRRCLVIRGNYHHDLIFEFLKQKGF
ncbi:hypothetical protein ACOME3_008352 [Neoechinorhynchus agilis]